MRITIKDLESLCLHLNEVTGNNHAAYTKLDTGGVKANIGTYYIYRAYGGYCLHQMANEGGGVSTPLTPSCVPARELYGKMLAFLRGIELGKASK